MQISLLLRLLLRLRSLHKLNGLQSALQLATVNALSKTFWPPPFRFWLALAAFTLERSDDETHDPRHNQKFPLRPITTQHIPSEGKKMEPLTAPLLMFDS